MSGTRETPADPADGGETLDPIILRQLTELEATGPGLVARLLHNFIDQAPKRIAVIASAVAAGDATAVREQAHALRGSSLNIGAMRLANICKRLESQAKLGNLQGAEESIDRLTDEFVRVRETKEFKSL